MKLKQIIMIMTDTQRKDMLSCYNSSNDMDTPFLDKLAEEGMKFEKAYCAQPVCGPARSAIFTGTYPHTNGSIANSMFLNQGSRTIGQRLNSHGIKTGFIGKWHLDGGDYFGNGECPEGWDENFWFDMRNYLDRMTDEERLKSRQFETVLQEDVLPDFTFAHQCSDRAIDFIEQNRNNDFFLVVSYDEPHHPYIAPRQYFEKFKNYHHNQYGNVDVNLSNHPEHIQVWSESVDISNLSTSALMGCNAYADKEIGRVLNAAENLTEAPFILYTSDHGAGLGAHGIFDKGPATYDEITNIPFIIRWPKVVNPKEINYQPVSHVDIVPTILEFFGLEIPKSLEGKSLVPMLKDSSEKVNEYVFMEFTRYEVDHDGFGGFQPLRSVTDGRFKLTINLMTTDELYDLDVDKGEMHNLIDADLFKDERNRLHDALLEWMNTTRDPYRGYYWEQRPWRNNLSSASWDYSRMTRQRYTEKDEVGQLNYATGLPITEYTREK